MYVTVYLISISLCGSNLPIFIRLAPLPITIPRLFPFSSYLYPLFDLPISLRPLPSPPLLPSSLRLLISPAPSLSPSCLSPSQSGKPSYKDLVWLQSKDRSGFLSFAVCPGLSFPSLASG